MSFLDELKQQAEEERQRELEETQNRLRALNENFTLVDAKMQRMFRYLLELSNHLNGLRMQVKRSYYLEGCGNLEGWMQQDYQVAGKKFNKDEHDYLKEVHFKFRVVGPEAVVVEKTSEASAEHFRDYLWRHNLRFEAKEFRNQRAYLEKAVFTIAPEIPVGFFIVADHEQGIITISLKNFGMFGVNEMRYDADEVNDGLVDEMAKYVVGKPSHFRSLGRRQQQAAAKVQAEPPEAPVEEEHPYNIVHEEERAGKPSPLEEEGRKLKDVFSKVKSILNTRIG